ncbi:Regulator of RpoS [subsurface metagenome]
MSKHKILYVEDEVVVLLGISKELEAAGYEVTTATSGEKAIKLLEKKSFDLVISDVVMGEVDGFEVVEKAKELCPETITMILTGYEETDFAIKALRLGVDDYMLKPYETENFSFRVKRCLEKGEFLRKNKQTEAELLFLSSAIKQSTEGIGTVDLEGILIFVNEAMAAMHGYLPEELIGKHLSIFHTPEQMADVEKANKQTQETGEFIGEIWHMRKDRTIFPGIMHNSIIQDENGNPIGITGTLRDITERKKSEEILKIQEQVLESMAEGVNMSDENGIIFFTNPRFDALFGYERDKLIGKNVLVLNSYSAKENAQYVAEVIKQLETKGTWSGEVSNRKKDGTQFSA